MNNFARIKQLEDFIRWHKKEILDLEALKESLEE